MIAFDGLSLTGLIVTIAIEAAIRPEDLASNENSKTAKPAKRSGEIVLNVFELSLLERLFSLLSKCLTDRSNIRRRQVY